MIIPDKTLNYRVFKDAKDLLGTADVELPEIEQLTDTLKGAGIAGEIDVPTVGHIAAMSMTINWRTVTGDLIALSAPKAHQLDLRATQQHFDTSTGLLKNVAVKHVVSVVPKKLSIGKLETAAATDSSNEFSVMYYKLLLDGEVKIEIDPLNYIYYIDGVDYLAEVRKDLGLA